MTSARPTIRFFVAGTPAPGGSKRAFVNPRTKRAIVTDDCARSKPWRERVASTAAEHYRGEPLAGPLAVTMTFVMPRPKGHFGTGRNADTVRPTAPTYPAIKPDVLKLARSTEDALSSIIWRDDCQTVDLAIRKRYGARPGVWISIEPKPPEASTELPADHVPPEGWPPLAGRSAEPEDFQLH